MIAETESETFLPGFTAPSLPFNTEVYEERLRRSHASEAFAALETELNNLPDRADIPPETVAAAENLSLAIFDALEAAISHEKCGVSINYSTGKDSTLVLSLYIRWMLARQKAGKILRQTIIAIADTGSEFPEMEARIENEGFWIREFAKEKNLPIEVFVSRPPLKNFLLAELLGNGKPLPKITRGNTGAQASQWCMDRVKKTPLDAIQKRLEGGFPFYVAMMGVRSDESSRRSATISEYGQGFPEGLSKLGDRADAIGCIPIVHWNKNLMRHFLLASMEDESLMPWRPNGEGARELNRIYRDAAGPASSANPTECSLTVTKDGSISNSCSDLSGTRMGCWMCLLSKNKSLANLARTRPNYTWLKKFHSYVHGHHRRNFARAKLRDAAGFSQTTLFPKGFTFGERYFMTMLLARAEIESKITLLPKELEPIIEEFWEKYGVSGITIADARADAALWKKTGKPIPCFATNPYLASDLAETLGLSLPPGAFWTPSKSSGLKAKLERIHLLAMCNGNSGDPILPVLRAYIFNPADPSVKHLLIMITDTPSTFGTKTNTGLLNGLCGANWKLAGTREPTALELKLSDGRSFFYQSNHLDVLQKHPHLAEALHKPHAEKYGKADKDDPHFKHCERRAASAFAQINYANQTILRSGCPDDPLVDDWRRQKSIQEMAGMTVEEFKLTFHLVGAAVDIADHLEYVVSTAAAPALKRAREHPDLLGESSQKGSALRSSLRAECNEAIHIDSLRSNFLEYRRATHALGGMLRKGKASIGLISKMAYIHRMNQIDELDAEKELLALVRQIKPAQVTPMPADLPIAAESAGEN